jgi:hypothetical protein
MCLYTLGRQREARHIADSLVASYAANPEADSSYSPVVIAQGLAEYYAWIGDAKASLAWLERAFALSSQGEDLRVFDSGVYDKVLSDPRFHAGLEASRGQVFARVERARRAAQRR